MSSTNKTPNYELSQFVASDKPAWLTDINSDMSKIDTAIKSASDTATGADGKAEANGTKIGALENLTTSNKNNVVSAINEVDGHADTAQETANSASTIANQAKNTADTINNKLNLTQVVNTLNATASSGTVSLNNVKVVKNSDSSICKIYGTINISNVAGSGDITVTLTGSGLRPSSNINVNGCALITLVGNAFSSTLKDYTINSNGNITFTQTRYSDTQLISMQFIACLVFVKDFQD